MTLSLWPTLARVAAVATLVVLAIASEWLLADALGDDVIAVILLLIVAVIGIAWAMPLVVKGGPSR